LSIADEPFLEAALDDRSKEVRRVAADLLASLPDSRLCQRMVERLTSLVKFKKAVGRPYAFDVSLPETCNADMQRDGIEPKPRAPIGERTWWLQQMISATPLTFWERLEPIGITELIKLAQVNEWKDTFIQGWRSAIQRQQNQQWVEAFLQHANKLSQEDLQLLTVLTWEQCQSLACRLYQTSSHLVHSPGKDVALVLAQNRIPWNDDLARYVLQDVLRYWANHGSAWNWLMRELLKASALCIQFSFFSEAAALLSTGNDPTFAELVQPFLDTLHFRQEMMQVFEMRSGG
jgi:hypothetical protein